MKSEKGSQMALEGAEVEWVGVAALARNAVDQIAQVEVVVGQS